MTTQDNIKLPFALGSTAWVAHNYGAHREVVCPECVGSGRVRVVTAAGEHVVQCEMCSGFGEARGFITEHVIDVRPKEVTLVNVRYENGHFTYLGPQEPSGAQFVYYESELFASHDACLPKCEEKAVLLRCETDARMLATLRSKRRDCAFSAQYWKRKASELRKQMEFALARCGMEPKEPAP